jgi:hypothetical protein
MAGAGISVGLGSYLGYWTLLAAAMFVVIAAVLSFIPDWSPSDFPLLKNAAPGIPWFARNKKKQHARPSS